MMKKLDPASAFAVIVAVTLLATPSPIEAKPGFCRDSGCHTEAPVFDENPPVESQRDWQQAHGGGKGVWTERGTHAKDDSRGKPADATCALCHLPACDNCHRENVVHKFGPEPPTYPIRTNGTPLTLPTDQNCGTGCHLWVRPDVAVRAEGFTNASGDPAQTTYEGTIDPVALLARAETDAPLHFQIYESSGCAGFCHGGVDAPHGTITECVSCHSFSWGNTANALDPEHGNLHATHIPFVQAELPITDPETALAGRTACDYCHSGPVASAACWNCHLSGHDPTTPYWELPGLSAAAAHR